MMPGDEFQCDVAHDRTQVGAQLIRRAKGVLLAAHRERRDGDGGQVFDAEILGFAGRVQRVRQQDKRADFQAVSNRHRAHPAAERAPSNGDLVERNTQFGREVLGLRYDMGDGGARLLHAAFPGGAAREIDPSNRERGETFLEGNEGSVRAVSAGARKEHEARNVHETHRRTYHGFLCFSPSGAFVFCWGSLSGQIGDAHRLACPIADAGSMVGR